MAGLARELTAKEAVDLISPDGVGRLAFCTVTGPRIYPLSYVVDDASIVFRTSLHGEIAMVGTSSGPVTFEVDHLDTRHRRGWSVIATGPAERIADAQEVHRIAASRDPAPWAPGMRRLYIRIPWTHISGRVIGDDWLHPLTVAIEDRFTLAIGPWSHG